MRSDDQAAERTDTIAGLGGLLAAAEAVSPVEAIDAVALSLKDAFGAEHVSFLIADFSGDALIRLGRLDAAPTRQLGGETAQRVPLDATPQGRALSEQSVEILEEDGLVWLFAPVTSRGEALGVLELSLPALPDRGMVEEVARAAHALAYIVIANRRYTDLYEWGQRSVPLSLAAEIQHRLLPGSYTCEAGQFTLAAWLEPAGDVGGDTFDFSLDRDALSLSITDAMGHTVMASLLATLLVGSIRNGRRRGAGLAEQARLADEALAEHAGRSQFVTGQLARIDLARGTAEIVNAGHPPPLRLREGRVEEIPLEADPPFGALLASAYRVQALPLEPGDRILFLTDGVLERDAADADLPTVLRESCAEHPRKAVQRLIGAALEAAQGKLRDDATVLCLDWHGGPPREREAHAGANAAR